MFLSIDINHEFGLEIEQIPLEHKCVIFPECVAKGSRLTLGVWGRALFATRCFYVRNRSQPSAVIRRCHWGKLLEGVSDENVTCQIRVK